LCHLPKIIDFLGYAPYFGPCSNIGDKIVRYREFLGLSQKALAGHLGIDPGTLKRWEKYESEPLGKKLWKLNHFFHFYLNAPTLKGGKDFFLET